MAHRSSRSDLLFQSTRVMDVVYRGGYTTYHEIRQAKPKWARKGVLLSADDSVSVFVSESHARKAMAAWELLRRRARRRAERPNPARRASCHRAGGSTRPPFPGKSEHYRRRAGPPGGSAAGKPKRRIFFTSVTL